MKKRRAASRLRNREPRTWACECGMINFLDERNCMQCGDDRNEAWDANDPQCPPHIRNRRCEDESALDPFGDGADSNF